MDNKEIKALAGIMREMGLTSLEYMNGGESIKLRRAASVTHTAAVPADIGRDEGTAGQPEPDYGDTFTVKSPMVGVFYAAPGADMQPFVAAGSTVRSGDVLCIIEAMKIMNEITAERDGVIAEICVENKQIVEFGQVLFRMRNEE